MIRTSPAFKAQFEYWRSAYPEGFRIKFYNPKKLNYTYIVRHPKKLKVRIR